MPCMPAANPCLVVAVFAGFWGSVTAVADSAAIGESASEGIRLDTRSRSAASGGVPVADSAGMRDCGIDRGGRPPDAPTTAAGNDEAVADSAGRGISPPAPLLARRGETIVAVFAAMSVADSAGMSQSADEATSGLRDSGSGVSRGSSSSLARVWRPRRRWVSLLAWRMRLR